MPDTDPDAPKVPEGYFTAEQLEAARREAIEKARTEERDKLYPKINKQDEQFKAMQEELAALKQAEADRAKELAKRQAEAEKAKQKAADAELSAKELLEKRHAEWEAQRAQDKADHEARLAVIAEQQQLQQAMWDKEREMAQLAMYIRDQIEANRDNIAPELLDFIDGTTKEEVDASIERVKAKTAAIVEGMRQAQLQTRAGMPGVAPSGGATALTPGLDTGDRQLTPDDIKGMSMKDFAALRSKMGINGNGGQGLFG